MRLVIAFACLLIGSSLVGQQPECIHDPDACPAGMCKVWESSRFVCEPETYAVMVFPRKCLIKDALGQNARLEMNLDADGKPDRKTARVIGTEVEFKPGCGHIEIRKRNVNY